MHVAETVCEARSKQVCHLAALLVREARVAPVRARVLQVDLVVSHVQIAAVDDRLGLVEFTHVLSYSVLEFAAVTDAQKAVLGIRHIAADEIEIGIFKSDDLILIHGGGYIGSLWRGANDNMMYLIQNLPDNRIICLPNSFYCYADDLELEEKIINVFNAHQQLVVCLRDNSYFKYVDKVKNLKLLPDAALSYDFIDL